MFNDIGIAVADLKRSREKIYLALMLGWQDIKQRYRRSKLGPFWLTISMGVMIGMIGIVFGQVLNSPMKEYLPFLATGIILWTCFSTSVMEGSTSFIDAQGMIRQLDLPLSLYPIRVLWRNIVICGHNIIILPLVFLIVGKEITWNIFWVIPGFIVFSWNMLWISLLLGTFCTRFRDMPQIVNSLIQVFFYVTPIIWMPGALSARSASLLVEPNPAYHLLQIVRAPILGSSPTVMNWIVSVVVALIGSAIAVWFFGKYKKRIAYWL
ncbi:MAG TPA: ABC transporter permease [Candidatus Aphodousia faecigallinarum]|uniref:ABC transporter permease n=1 Tax=Candidatus Aphodousia faecigallinarum TaxID=2840677 RepID=A0A9D1IJH6_9BURK|nr:ABC transporter permease [Candidatus Aphodousia faecigallinarum]